jgi:N-sulfoglucosamine sulfohydrolase
MLNRADKSSSRAGWASALMLACCLVVPSGAASKPNVVIFISDDHTARDSSVYGSTDIVTPNMARIAADGMTFDRAYAASPTCAPSRAALLTGLMPARNGAEANHARPRADLKKLPAYLKEQGYEVVAFGKVGHYKQTKEYGFDFSEYSGFHEDVAVSEALEWLEARVSEKPLCLLVGTNWPHVPWPAKATGDHNPLTIQLPPTHVDTPVSREARARYYTAVSTMDGELGQVYDLSRKKFGDDLFFLHFSDQGAQWPFAKWTLYEDGIRVPMIAVWPGHAKAGTRNRAMVSLIDVLPTVVEVAGGPAPETIDGRSFAGVLTGKSTEHRDRIYTTHSGDGNFNVYPMRSLGDQRWKYILNLHPEFRFGTHITKTGEAGSKYWESWVEKAHDDPQAANSVRRYQERPPEELYDLGSDPWEEKNLAAEPEQAERLKHMRADLERWMTDQGDKRTVLGEPTTLSGGSGPEERK